MQAIVSFIYGADDLEKTNSIDLDDRAPFLEFHPRGQPPLLDGIAAQAPPRILKTHLPYKFMTKQTNLMQKKTKVICVIRNPKDTLVSYYHFYRMNGYFGCFQGSWNEFFELFKHNQIGFGTWFDMTLGWWEQRENLNMLTLKYEDMKKDLKGAVEKVAAFCGKELSSDQVDKIAEYTDFKQMKKNPMTNQTEVPDLHEDISPFMRKGQVGDWQNYFTDEQNAYFDDLYKKRMEGTGLTVDFL